MHFTEAKEKVEDNLESIRLSLVRCIEEGMIDSDAAYYNELIDLQEEAELSQSWEELEEVISQAKPLEMDVASWLSLHGRTSVSLPWPQRES